MPDQSHASCRVIGCGQPARAATSDGLDGRYCRHHADHYQRHGSPYRTSFTAQQLNPYRQAALAWLLEHPDDQWVQDAGRRVEGLYRAAGLVVEAFRLRGLPPQDRAKAAWARLRKHEVEPILVVAAWLAVEMALKDTPQAAVEVEYRRVQAAKVIHRMASGSHRRWERTVTRPGSPPTALVEELHTYPRSRGRVLRHVGEALEQAVGLLVGERLDTIRAFKIERDGRGVYVGRPYPKGWRARGRHRQ